jgi:hypothetical protein
MTHKENDPRSDVVGHCMTNHKVRIALDGNNTPAHGAGCIYLRITITVATQDRGFSSMHSHTHSVICLSVEPIADKPTNLDGLTYSYSKST